jgi:hypothetical protein
MPVDEAAVRIGLEVQYLCVADPAGWDPIHGKSPVHFAGKVHQQALLKAVRRADRTGAPDDASATTGDAPLSRGCGRKPSRSQKR